LVGAFTMLQGGNEIPSAPWLKGAKKKCASGQNSGTRKRSGVNGAKPKNAMLALV